MILLLQVSAVFVVITLFRLLPDTLAGLLASSLFITVAITTIVYLYQNLKFKSLGLIPWILFLLCFAIPMISSRLYYFGLPTDEIFIGPIAFVQMHAYSEKAYLIAFFANLYDYIRIKKAAK